MISAKEAKELTLAVIKTGEENKQKEIELELKRVEDFIKEAIEKGKNKIYFYHNSKLNASEAIDNKLKELGYIVTYNKNSTPVGLGIRTTSIPCTIEW